MVDGRGNGCAMFELSDSRADVRLWAAQGRVALRYATLKREANGLSPAPVGSCAQIVPKLSKAHAPPRARRVEEIGSHRVAYSRLESGGQADYDKYAADVPRSLCACRSKVAETEANAQKKGPGGCRALLFALSRRYYISESFLRRA